MPTAISDRIIALVAGAAPAAARRGVTRETHLKRELGLDSIALLALVFRFEQELGIDLGTVGADVDVGRLRTVGDVIDTAAMLLGRGHEDTTAGHEGTKTGHEGTKTGHEGTKTGHEGTKAGHEGTKTGHEGTKAGHEGTKTGHEGTKTGHEGTKAGHEGTKAGHEGTKARHEDTKVTKVTQVTQVS